MNKILLLLLLAFSTGCATTHRQKSLYAIGIGVASGASLGSSRPKYKGQNALMYGASIGVIAAITSLYLFDNESEVKRLEAENRMFAKQLGQLNQDSNYSQKETLSNGSNLFESNLPNNLKNLVKPGKWKLYKTSRWIQDEYDESTWIHVNKIFEVKLPNLKGEEK